MIIKTLRCKKKDFSKMLSYVWSEQVRDADELTTFTLSHNLRSRELGSIIEEFKQNDQYRKERKRGVVLYHEILSFSPEDRKKITVEMLQSIATEYIRLRNDRALCLCRPHLEKDHLHLHFVFSGTEFKSAKTLRMDNEKFKSIRKQMEVFQKHYFPELTHSLVYENFEKKKTNKLEQDRNTRKQRSKEMSKRVGEKMTEKQVFIQTCMKALESSKTINEFIKAIQREGLETYKRGKKINGVVSTGGRKYRFTSLVGKSAIVQLQQNQVEYDKRLKDLRDVREQEITRDRDRRG